MNYKGGAIIKGSLFWENTPTREKWRNLFLEPLENKIPTKLRIRYGRESRTRDNTYTMIVTNHNSTDYGTAFIVPFKKRIKNARILEEQAFAMAGVEGLWKKDKSSLNKNWGTVGLMINPELEKNRNLQIIKERWGEIYSDYNFDNSVFTIENEKDIINKNGIIDIDWTFEMKDFDFLILTLTVPNPKRLLTSKEIAERIKGSGYKEYFENNIKNGIVTFQDIEIKKILT